MKWLVLLLFLTLITDQDEFLIANQKVGTIGIGARVEEIYDAFEKDKETKLVDRYFEASFSPAMQVFRDNQVLFVANIDCSKITSIEVFGKMYKTAAGVSVGTSFEKLKQSGLKVQNREGSLAVVDPQQRLIYQFESTKEIQKLNLSTATLKDIPAGTKITSITIF